MVIVWNDNLATGNEKIDAQHKEIFGRFNDFQSACQQGKGLDELSSLFSFLHEYVRSHLALEERLQVEYEYPGYLAHKEEHGRFIRDIGKLEEQLNSFGTTPALLVKTNMVLVEWLIRHFTWTDKKLTDFLQAAVPDPARPLAPLPTHPRC
jgi:hemerythrin